MNRIFLLIVFFSCFKVHAYFGFGPCCSGYTCGVIPCDSTCAGPAFKSFTNSFKLNLNNLESNASNYIQTLSTTNSNSIDLYNSLVDDENSKTDQISESYSRYATGFSANLDLLTHSYINSSTVCMNGITNTLKNINLTQASKMINESLSLESLPQRELSIINGYEMGLELFDENPANNTQLESLLSHKKLDNDVKIQVEILRGSYFDILESYINGSKLTLSDTKKLAVLLAVLDETEDKENSKKMLSLSYTNQNMINESLTESESLERIQKSEPSSLHKQLAILGQVENSKLNHLLKLVKIGE